MTDFIKQILTLVGYALSEEESMPDLPQDFSYPAAYLFGDCQQILPVLYYGACKTEQFIQSDSLMQYMQKCVSYNELSERQMNVLSEIGRMFSEAGIGYMPLKGSILKRCYPEADMRMMSDCDILIQPGKFEQADEILLKAGYTAYDRTSNVYEYDSPDKVGVELHKTLIPPEQRDLYAYYGEEGGWQLAHPTDTPCLYEMKNEDFFVFIFTHFVKHYRGLGAGIKFILDFRVFETAHPDMDREYIRGELAKLGLDVFYGHIERLMAVWFDGAPEDEMSEHLTKRLFDSQVYGTEKRGVISDAYLEKKTGDADGSGKTSGSIKLKRWLSLFFLPYANMCYKYEVLKKWPILLPLFWIVRGFDMLFNRRHRIAEVRRSNEVINDKALTDFEQELAYVGLEYRFDQPGGEQTSENREKRNGEEL